MTIDARGFSMDFDGAGGLSGISFQGERFHPPAGPTLFEIDSEIAAAAAGPAERTFTLGGRNAGGTLALTADSELRMKLAPEREGSIQTVGIVISLPDNAELHVPQDYNLAHWIRADMPPGEEYSTPLGFNFLLVQVGGMWIRFLARQSDAIQRRRAATASVSRHPGLFMLTFTWKAADEAAIGVFPSMDAAVADFRSWLEKDLGIRKLADRASTAAWVRNVKLILIMDMMRSDGAISHDYADITRLAGELAKSGCPKDTLLYLPGWNGAYDAMYPTYLPHAELGGTEGFRRMMDALHGRGFRVMIHTNPWGVDPSHPQLEAYLPYLLKDKNGRYAGFQTDSNTKWGMAAPGRRPLKFRTGKVPVEPGPAAGSCAFETVRVPDKCESVLSIGGITPGEYRVRVTIGRRTITSPPGAFAASGEHEFEFPFLLWPGKNAVRIEALEGAAVDLGRCWYRIDRCFVPPDRYSTWTYPILFADTANPAWCSLYAGNVAAVVREYGIDAMHCDATEYQWNKPVYDELERLLPDIPKAGEGFATLSAMGYWTFCQMGVGQSLIGYLDLMRGTRQQGSIPDTAGLEELYSWLDRPSPVAGFIRDYLLLYPHLCAADAFVPTAKVCNTSPIMKSPRSSAGLWKVVRDARRLDYLPALRLNFRDHGVDRDAKKAIREIASWSR